MATKHHGSTRGVPGDKPGCRDIVGCKGDVGKDRVTASGGIEHPRDATEICLADPSVDGDKTRVLQHNANSGAKVQESLPEILR